MLVPLDLTNVGAYAVIRHDNLYTLVAQLIADFPEDQQLPELVSLMMEIRRAGVDLSQHWDCLLEGIILEEIR